MLEYLPPSLGHRLVKRFALAIKTVARTISRVVFPHFCPLCQSASQSYFCTECFANFKPIEHACSQCHVPLSLHNREHLKDPLTAHRNIRCADCLKQTPSFNQAICAFEYSHPFADCIRRFKEQGDYHAADQACNALAQKVVEHYSNRGARPMGTPELLVPVPIHWKKRWQRGFNQSEYIAEKLGRDLGIPSARAVTKTNATIHQKTLSKKARQKNLRASFRAIPSMIDGKYIALIDDVITTGSTANVLAELCLKFGARRVDIWALARTPKND